MDVPLPTHSLTSLLVFQSAVRKELIRTLHVYGSSDEGETEVEREFVFDKKGPYVETKANPLFPVEYLRRPEISPGTFVGSWICIFVFHSDSFSGKIPYIISVSRNPKLKAIPGLANDLQIISKCIKRSKQEEPQQDLTKEQWYTNGDSSDDPNLRKIALKQDLNCLPDPETTSDDESEREQIEQQESDVKRKKKKRAPSKHVAGLCLEDLTKYFDLPIIEACIKLNVGVTVLKRKCREFGIPRWPHRKIKSLDGLIRDLQGEAERQVKKDETAATAVAKRQKLLEIEKKEIEEKPFMEIQTETKRFRQDIFKRRHRAIRSTQKTEASRDSSA